MGFHALFAAPLTLQPRSLFSTRSLLGLEAFGLCCLSLLSGPLRRGRPFGLNPFSFPALSLDSRLLHPLLL
jgi:hypothetical protein